MARVGFIPRLLAAVIDVALFLPILIAALVFDELVLRYTDPFDSLRDALLPLLWLSYSSTEMFFAATPGKMILRQRIVTARGEPADFWTKSLRWQTKQFGFICLLLLALSGFLGFHLLGGFMNTVLLAGFAATLNDGKRAWHDEWAGTAVVRRPRAGAVPPPLPVR